MKFRDQLIDYLKRMAVFLFALMYLELIFHLFAVEGNIEYLPQKLAMCLPTAVVLSIITCFWPQKVGNVIESVLLGFMVIYYCVNIIFHDFFQVYFTIEMINPTNTKIAQYYREIAEAIVSNWLPLALILVVPIGSYVLLRVKKINDADQIKGRFCYIPILALLLALGIEIGVTLAYGQDEYSPYDLMTGVNVNEFSFGKLGVIATGEVEIKNLITKNETASDSDNDLDDWDDTDWMDEDDSDNEDELLVSVDNNSNGNGEDTSGESNGETEEQETDPVTEIIEKIIDTSPNVLDIDFAALSESESNSDIAKMHSYFGSLEPTKKNEYTGMFEGYNLIFLTAESFCTLAIDEKYTPTLYKLSHEGFVFTNFYNPRTGGSTSDGEFVCNTSLVPTNGGAKNFRIVGGNHMPFALGNLFNMKYGITSRAYHNNDYTYYGRDETYPGMGYYYTGVGNGLKISKSWPESDLEMMQATVDEYMDDDLFHVYYMTVSGHKNYTWSGNAMSKKHKEEVSDLPYSSACKGYIACQMEFDQALGYLIQQLEERGIADRTVICFTGDHWPYGLTNEQYSELLGHEVETNFELFKSTLVLWSGSIKEPIVIDKACGSLDIIPTLLNLFGFDYDSRLFMGKDILSDSEGFVTFINRSFITDRVMYNSKTKETTVLTDDELPENYVKNCIKQVNNKFKYSQKIMDTDYYKYICDAMGIEIPKVEQNY